MAGTRRHLSENGLLALSTGAPACCTLDHHNIECPVLRACCELFNSLFSLCLSCIGESDQLDTSKLSLYVAGLAGVRSRDRANPMEQHWQEAHGSIHASQGVPVRPVLPF